MKISQNLYDKLVEKRFYRFICKDDLFNCFNHYGSSKREIIDYDKLETILNQYQIFRHSVDKLDYEIYRLFHAELHNGGEDYLILSKPSIADERTLWLEPEENIFGVLGADAEIESNCDWITSSKSEGVQVV